MKRKALGRGLEALLKPDHAAAPGFRHVAVNRISPNPNQPRLPIADEAVEELARSIRTHGVLQPILLSAAATPDHYILIAGERRWRASLKAGLSTVPAIVREVSDRETLEIALIENLQRQDLNAIEEARAYQRLAEDFELTHEQVARRVGKERSTVTNMLRLLRLPHDLQQMLLDGALTMGHARVLAGLDEAAARVLAQRIVEEGLSVRQTEREARLGRSEARTNRPRGRPMALGPDLRRVQHRLEAALGVRVGWQGSKAKGSITLRYDNAEQFERLERALHRALEGLETS